MILAHASSLINSWQWWSTKSSACHMLSTPFWSMARLACQAFPDTDCAASTKASLSHVGYRHSARQTLFLYSERKGFLVVSIGGKKFNLLVF